MASRKRKKRKKGQGAGGASKPAARGAEAAGANKASSASGPGASSPSVMQFLERLGGAPTAPRRSTPARGLLGDISRKDLVAAGRIDADSPEGPPADPHPTGPAPVELHDAGAPLEIEVSTPDGAPVGRRAERKVWREVVKVASVVAGPHRAASADFVTTVPPVIAPFALNHAGWGGTERCERGGPERVPGTF